jgi:hypothetical protein
VRKTQLIAAASLIVLGLSAIFIVIPYAVVDAPSSSGLSPAFMPYVAASLATLAALGWLVSELRRASGDRAAPAAAVAIVDSDWRFVVAGAAVLGVSFLLTSTVGYLAGGAALVAGTLALARAKLATIVATAVIAPVALWVLFVHVLATPLP